MIFPKNAMKLWNLTSNKLYNQITNKYFNFHEIAVKQNRSIVIDKSYGIIPINTGKMFEICFKMTHQKDCLQSRYVVITFFNFVKNISYKTIL